jgi:hypothetical protein
MNDPTAGTCIIGSVARSPESVVIVTVMAESLLRSPRKGNWIPAVVGTRIVAGVPASKRAVAVAITEDVCGSICRVHPAVSTIMLLSNGNTKPGSTKVTTDAGSAYNELMSAPLP